MPELAWVAMHKVTARQSCITSAREGVPHVWKEIFGLLDIGNWPLELVFLTTCTCSKQLTQSMSVLGIHLEFVHTCCSACFNQLWIHGCVTLCISVGVLPFSIDYTSLTPGQHSASIVFNATRGVFPISLQFTVPEGICCIGQCCVNIAFEHYGTRYTWETNFHMEKFSVQTDISVLEVWTRTGFEIVRALINPGPPTNTADRRIPTFHCTASDRSETSAPKVRRIFCSHQTQTHTVWKFTLLSHFVLNSIFTYC